MTFFTVGIISKKNMIQQYQAVLSIDLNFEYFEIP